MVGTKRKRLEEFCDYTTVHGLSCLVRQSRTSMRIVWTFIVLGGFAGLSLHLNQIIYSYLQYKSTESTYEKRTGFHFPDVTVCNLHGISSSNFKNTINKNLTFKNVSSEILETIHTRGDSSDSEKKSKETGYFRSRENLFWGLENEAEQVGYKLQDMVLSCQFERRKCEEEEDFVLFQYPELFNCYTFKKGRNSTLTTVNGLGGALSLVLYTEPQGNDISYIYDDLVVANNQGLCKL